MPELFLPGEEPVRECDNCGSKTGFAQYMLHAESGAQQADPDTIWRCAACGVTLTEDEYNELERSNA